jgi:hypothetical protein
MGPRAFLIAVAILASATPAFAAGDPPDQPPQTQGPMIVERTHNGWVIAPDVQVGKVGSTTATSMGAYGGYMFENTILVGGAGYWQLNRSAARQIDYGGGIVEWLAAADRPVGFGARALVGGGSGTLTSSLVALPLGLDNDGRSFVLDPFFGRPIPINIRLPVPPTQVRYSTGFFIFEPQGNLLINLNQRLRIRAAGGYRVIGAGHGWSSQLNGAMGSVGLEIGGTSSRRVSP